MQIIENKYLKVTINEKGAILNSIIYKPLNKEVQYQIQKDSWAFQDVVIFPLVGAGNYEYQNKNYTFSTRHGFLRTCTLDVLESKKDSITLGLKANEETLKVYPFNFSFSITYTLDKNKLVVSTNVKNLGKEELCFSYGSHTALKANSESGYIKFNKDFKFLPLNCGLIDVENKENLSMNSIDLKKSTFQKLDTLVYKGENEELTLFTGFDDIKVIYNFNTPYFAIWSNAKTGDFICVEPWWGISNYINESKDLSSRVAINKLKENEVASFSYSYTFKNN